MDRLQIFFARAIPFMGTGFMFINLGTLCYIWISKMMS